MQVCFKHRSKSSAVHWVLAGALSVVLLTTGKRAFAQSTLDATENTQSVSDYYTIDEELNSFKQIPGTVDMSPLTGLSLRTLATSLRATVLNLLRWTLHPQGLTEPPIKYNRKAHFGRWINDPTDETCYNTRAKVLIRDSEAPVSFKERNHCLVETGNWLDPYSGTNATHSSQIQIDHMVPLKHAYISGAWEWDFQTRCTYANFMGNNFHLISAGGHENMSKGDSSPDEYLPPNESYRCQYLENWLKIKLIWNLKMGPSEAESIRQEINDRGCDTRKFSLTAVELKRQRKLIYDSTDLCPGR